MSKAKGESSKPTPDERKMAAAARRRQKADELRERRTKMLQTAQAAARGAEDSLRELRERIRRHEALAHHLQSFYAEVDKLAKGNRQIEATALTVQQANEIVLDAKAIVHGDVYLDRVKEFVPAGENPVYPDVLMVAATVQAAVQRAGPLLAAEQERQRATRRKAATIAAAAQLILQSGEPPLEAEVEEEMGGKPESSWFYEAEDQQSYFDINRFDDSDVSVLFGAGEEE